MSKSVTVDINEDGSIKIEVDGVVGNSCDVITGKLLKSLDADVISDDKKPEYYAQESVKSKS